MVTVAVNLAALAVTVAVNLTALALAIALNPTRAAASQVRTNPYLLLSVPPAMGFREIDALASHVEYSFPQWCHMARPMLSYGSPHCCIWLAQMCHMAGSIISYGSLNVFIWLAT